MGPAFRYVPRLYVMHDRVPLGSRLRQADRGDQGADRASSSAIDNGTSAPLDDLQHVSSSGSAEAAAACAARVPAVRTAITDSRIRIVEAVAETAGRDGNVDAKARRAGDDCCRDSRTRAKAQAGGSGAWMRAARIHAGD